MNIYNYTSGNERILLATHYMYMVNLKQEVINNVSKAALKHKYHNMEKLYFQK